MHRLARLLAPRAVAVLGDAPGASVGRRVLEALLAGRFEGSIHAVTPTDPRLPGVESHADLSTLGSEIDLAVITASHATLGALVRGCADRGVAAAIILPTPEHGFGRDASTASLAPALVAQAAAGGMRLVGPNSFGLIRPEAHLLATLASPGVSPGSLALVAQSGGVCTAILDWAAERSIGFSAVVSLGDAADLDFGEVLEFLALDPATKSILLHVESVRSARSFLSGLRLAARMKPVVVVKTGGGDAGGYDEAADEAFDAALARSGAVRVASIAQMFVAVQFLSSTQQVEGNRLAVVSNSHGLGRAAADWARRRGVSIPSPSAATRDALQQVTAPSRTSNPIDLHPCAEPVHFELAVKALLADPHVDAVLAMLAPNLATDAAACAAAVVLARDGAPKPVLASWLGDKRIQTSRETLARGGIPDFAAPERAIEAFSYLAAYGRNQELLQQVPEPISQERVPDTVRAREIVRGALQAGRDRLTTDQLRKLLATIGVRDRDSAGLGVSGRELSIAVSRDLVFGPVIRFGRGEKQELLGEGVVALPPLNTAMIRTLLRHSRLADMFTSSDCFTDPAAAVERTLWAVSELVSEVPEIHELVLPSLIASGHEVYACGARAGLCAVPAGAGRYDHMAIHPYPSEIRAQWTVSGAVVIVRPIRPEDAVMEASFVRNLSDAARYFRFMVGLQELPRELLIRFTQIDYDRELALVALITRGSEHIQIGVARYVMTDPLTANVAIVISDEWQRQGIGKRLFGMLIDAARARGITRLEGEVLAENQPATALVKGFGFDLSASPYGDDLVQVEKVIR